MTTLKQVLLKTYKDLAILEEKLAKQGGSPDLRLINMIEDHRSAIALIEEALATELTDSGLNRLKEDLRPLLINDRVIDQIEVDKIVVPLPFEPEMVLIESGPFLMGRPAGEGVPEEETPRHEVTLPAFQIGKYPITNAQYAEFIKQEPQQEIPKKAGWFLREPPADKLDHPVVGISWHDAKAYCDWLTNRTGRTYRLPTEAEWEKAAAWTGQAQWSYPWGDTFDSLKANTYEGGNNDTTPVGAFSPQGDSPSGCADMAGNVQEWTSTLWGMDLNKCDYPYPYRVNDGREDPQAAQRLHRVYYIHRGGSYRDDQTRVRCSLRGYSDPDSKIKWRGFRVVLEV
jgi:formylglycine-generating enzyme required for sulfatase activity